ncbi:HAD-IB family phosphatase [bacterium]|nr:HAD-IB family phosphatase [bacterium]
MNGKKCYILDFDGTVTALDTLVVAFDKYCIVDWRELENEMRAGNRERHQTLVDEVESMKAEKEELFDFIKKNVPVREGFFDFVKKVRENGDEIVILSGGFRSFAELIMENTEVEAYINDIRYLGDKNWELIPCQNALPPLCTKNCSNCKRAVVEKYKNEGFETIYFGDGETDFCGSRYADRIYATDELAEKLASENVKFTYFQDYTDIL